MHSLSCHQVVCILILWVQYYSCDNVHSTTLQLHNNNIIIIVIMLYCYYCRWSLCMENWLTCAFRLPKEWRTLRARRSYIETWQQGTACKPRRLNQLLTCYYQLRTSTNSLGLMLILLSKQLILDSLKVLVMQKITSVKIKCQL